MEQGIRHRGFAYADQQGRVLEKCGLTLVRATAYEGPYVIGGSEHGEVEYALTRSEWDARVVRRGG
jgi:hypothetical protein